MKVISNTSPLIGFSKIGQFPLLKRLFQTIKIPLAVNEEFLRNCTAPEKNHFLIASQEFIEVIEVKVQHSFSRSLYLFQKFLKSHPELHDVFFRNSKKRRG